MLQRKKKKVSVLRSGIVINPCIQPLCHPSGQMLSITLSPYSITVSQSGDPIKPPGPEDLRESSPGCSAAKPRGQNSSPYHPGGGGRGVEIFSGHGAANLSV